MIDIPRLLYEICDDEAVLNPNCELIESGILDSLAFIELFAKLEELGINISPTRVDRDLLKTPSGIEKMVEDYLKLKI